MAQFQIVELTPEGEVPLAILGKFPSGSAAALSVRSLSDQYPERKFQPRPVADEQDWRARELSRFETGEYQGVDWDLEPITDHFVHRAQKNAENVAFTASDEHGMQDRQTSIHVNTYLHRFYPELPIEQRRKLVRDFTGHDPAEFLRFANDADEIAEVYEDGPGSCMAWPGENFAEGWHPASSYFGRGLTVAYLKKNGRITARAVVHLERKIWARIYGDDGELSEALKANGYREGVWEGDWQGVEFPAKWVDGEFNDDDDDTYSVEGYACPYLDFANRGRVEEDSSGKFFVIDRNGDYSLQYTNGCSEQNHPTYSTPCPVCKTSVHGSRYDYQCDNGTSVDACGNCCVEKYSYCAVTGYPLTARQDAVTLHDGRRARNHRSYVKQCSITGEWFRVSECELVLKTYMTPAELREHHQKAA